MKDRCMSTAINTDCLENLRVTMHAMVKYAPVTTTAVQCKSASGANTCAWLSMPPVAGFTFSTLRPV